MQEINEISEILAEYGLGTVGMDIFDYSAPADAANCIIAYPPSDVGRIEPETPSYYQSKFQVIVRNDNIESGKAICKQIQEALTLFNVDRPTIIIKRCRPTHQAKVYRRAASGYVEFTNLFDIRYITK